jgi:hypothetical protein
MNINFENNLFHGKIQDVDKETLLPTNGNLFIKPEYLSGKINELRQRIFRMKEVIYQSAINLDNEVINWNIDYPVILAQLEEYERSVNDRLFLKSDSEGFFDTIVDTFTLDNKIDYSKSTNIEYDPLTQSVTLDNSTEKGLSEINSSDFTVKMYMAPGNGAERIIPVYGSSFANLNTGTLSAWTGQVITRTPKVVSVVIEVSLGMPAEIGQMAISIVDASLSGSVSAIAITEDNSAYVIVENQAIANTNTFLVNRKVSKINIVIKKNNYCEKYDTGEYRYIFQIKNLALKKNVKGYKTEGIFRSSKESVLSNKFALEVCDFENETASIDYYIITENNNFNAGSFDTYGYSTNSSGMNFKLSVNYSGLSVDKPEDVSGKYADLDLEKITIQEAGSGWEIGNIVTFSGDGLGVKSPDNDLSVIVTGVDSGEVQSFAILNGSYSLGDSSEIWPINKPPGNGPRVFSLVERNTLNNISNPIPLSEGNSSSDIISNLPPEFSFLDQKYKYVNQILNLDINSLNDVNVFSNHIRLNGNESLLEEEGMYYTTWVYVDSSSNPTLDIGESSAIEIPEATYSRGVYTFPATKWYKVKIPIGSYIDYGSSFINEINLKNLDKKYPYNGKYLIEGTNLNINPYKGFAVRAKKKFARCSSLSSLNKDNFYLMKMVNYNSAYLVVLHSETNIRNAYIEYPNKSLVNPKQVSLFAKLKTSNNAVTPIISSYKIKLGD